VALPLIRDNGERFGTFELWHRSCRELPICGIATTQHSDIGGESVAFAPLLYPDDVRPPLVPKNGLSLLDCLPASPGMLDFLPRYGQQDGRDLKRFDLDFDLPDHFLAEFPPAIYLTPRTDLGDVSRGKLVSLTNYYQLFNGLLTPRQLEGLRYC
jgi:hypothetical protein